MIQSALRTDYRAFDEPETAEFDPSQSSDAALKMLIADDDPSIVKVIADRCMRMGFDVETATNGIQAALKATRYEPDVLVIDVNMPEIDGLSVCAHLLTPDRMPLNVIVVTGSRDPEWSNAARALAHFTLAREQTSGTSSRPRSPISIRNWNSASGNPACGGRKTR